MGSFFGSLFGDCILTNNSSKEKDEYKERIENTLSGLNDKIDNNRVLTKDEIGVVREDVKELRSEIKEVRVETRDGIKDLKDDLKFYYGRGGNNSNSLIR